MSYIELLIGSVGQGLEYPVDTEITPADPALGRAAVVDRRWQSMSAVVGTPIVPSEDVGLARQLANGIQFHSTVELDVGTPVRFGGREYAILNVQLEQKLIDAPVYRYQAKSQVKGIENAI